MLSSRISSIIVLMVAIGGISSIMVSDSATKSPLVFSKWPPYPNSKSSALRHQIFQHLRTTGRIPQNMIVKRYPTSMSYMMRPMKYAQLKKVPLPQASYYRPTISTPPRYRFQSSPAAPQPGEYIFENPFNNVGYQPNKKKISLTDDTKYNPIHTVPAPNLHKNLAYSTQTEYIHEPVDNQIFEQKDPQFNQITFRPLTVPQYQVTEQINDHTIRVDPFSKQTKIYVSDSAQSIPTYKIAQSFDSFNQPSAVASRPLPFEISFIPAQPQPQPQSQQQSQPQISSAPVASPLIQMANQVPPQQQLPDTYAIPIGNQPQLQQHLLQQQSMIQNVPLSVYNPTYLVTQSNNLLKQHREQLFKPSPSHLETLNQSPSVDLAAGNTQSLQDVGSVASAGQLLTSAQSQHKQHEHTNSISLRPDFSVAAQLQHTDNTPTFQRYVADRPTGNGIVVQQPVLTESELNTLLNIGNHENDNQNPFVASTYYQSRPDPQIELENRQRQQFNDFKIAKANEELKEKINTVEGSSSSSSSSSSSPSSTPLPLNGRRKTAHQQHQEKLAEQFTGKTALRIYVPDDDYQKKNDVRRSDFIRSEMKNDYLMMRRDDYHRDENQYFFNDVIQDTTTNPSEDDYLNDTESVDRLALDGETNEPINSSTINSYNY
ncbi:uncharacterized protein LOC116336745 [Contarinia nasturtii]|uniref:uncharacterized protein LOC116336745 n=1 Tax=Contarinia nasturtii TaxID=265458 RepID=UPI0012D4908E|nr:uncharacterized protein LOC116336745 [Contarinia nasturtii]